MFFFHFITNQNLFVDSLIMNLIKIYMNYYFLPIFLHFISNIIFIDSLDFHISILIRKYDLNSNLIDSLKINYLRSNFEVRNFTINYYFHFLNN